MLSVRAKYHGVVIQCARLGVLEDARGAARRGRASDQRDEPAWERFIRGRTLHEDALSVREVELSMAGGALAQQKACSTCRPIFRTRYIKSCDY